MNEDYLMHYGRKGQKWGVRNGPPYPLNGSSMSKEERRLNTGKLGAMARSFSLNNRDRIRAVKQAKLDKAKDDYRIYNIDHKKQLDAAKRTKHPYEHDDLIKTVAKSEKLKRKVEKRQLKVDKAKRKVDNAILSAERDGYKIYTKNVNRYGRSITSRVIEGALIGVPMLAIGDAIGYTTGYGKQRGTKFKVKEYR